MTKYLEKISLKITKALVLTNLPTYNELIEKGFNKIKQEYPNSFIIVEEKSFKNVLINFCNFTEEQALEHFLHESEHMNILNKLGYRKISRYAIFIIRQNDKEFFVQSLITLFPINLQQARIVLDVSKKSKGDLIQLKNLSI